MVRRRRDSGFTLIELLISLGISMVGLLGLMSLQGVAVRANGSSRNMAEAIGLAQQRLELLQLSPFATLNTKNLTEPYIAPSEDTSVQNIYNRVTVVTVGAATTTLTVTVSWADPDIAGRTHQVSMASVRSP